MSIQIDEKMLVGRWFVGVKKMPEDIRDYIIENKQIPDGLTDGILLANDSKTKYEAHRVDATVHNSADSTNIISAPDATDLTSLVTLANEMKQDYNAHIADATVHNAADTTNVVIAANATDIVSAVELINSIKAAYEAHRADTTIHNASDTTNIITKMNAYAWRQTWMGEAGGKYEITRETVDSKRQLFGVVRTQIKTQGIKVTLPISTSKFGFLRDYAKIDPNAAADAQVIFLEENYGSILEGIAVLAYPNDADPTNTSDIPNFTKSDETLILFDGVNKGTVTKDFNGEQGLLGLELDGMADTLGTAGKALGKRGAIGQFAKIS